MKEKFVFPKGYEDGQTFSQGGRDYIIIRNRWRPLAEDMKIALEERTKEILELMATDFDEIMSKPWIVGESDVLTRYLNKTYTNIKEKYGL